jgi:molybdopterin molybdotransferase
VIVTTGGTGKGEKDLLSDAISILGGDVLFHGVAMSPGKQALFAKLGGPLLFGLPGRPAATYIAFEQLVRPVLLRMLGLSQVFPPETTAVLNGSVKVRGKTLSFLFGRLIFGPAGLEVESLRSKRKGILTEMLAANCLLRVPPGRDRLEKGEPVTVQLLDLGLDGLSYFQVPTH